MERLNYAMNQTARENVNLVHQFEGETGREEEMEAAAKTAVENILAEASELERRLYNARLNELTDGDAPISYEERHSSIPYTKRLDLIERRMRGKYALTRDEYDAFDAYVTPAAPEFDIGMPEPARGCDVISYLPVGDYVLSDATTSIGYPRKSYSMWDVRRGRTRAELLYDIDALAARIRRRWQDVEDDEIRDDMLYWVDAVMENVTDTASDEDLLDKLRFLHDQESHALNELVQARMGCGNIDPDGVAHWDAPSSTPDNWLSMYLVMDIMQERRARRLNKSRYEGSLYILYDAYDYVYDVGPSFAAWRGWVDTTLEDYRNGGERSWRTPDGREVR